MKTPLNNLKLHIADILSILKAKKSKMVGHNGVPRNPKPQAASNALPSFVKLDDDKQEFYASIPPYVKKPTGFVGKSSSKINHIKQSINLLATTLRHAEDYSVFHLTDKEMGMVDSAFFSERGNINLTSYDRAEFRRNYKTELTKGIRGMCINIFGFNQPGCMTPSCIYVWKVPLVDGGLHAGNVQEAIDKCKELLPKKVSAESTRHFDTIIQGIAKVPVKVRAALKDYLFGGELNVKGGDAELYYEFVENLASGLHIDDSWIVDGRAFNSCGGTGIHITKFEQFWTECRWCVSPIDFVLTTVHLTHKSIIFSGFRILHSSATTDEHRHSNTLFASEVLSIPDLRKRAYENLELMVNSGQLSIMPNIPSVEWIRLQFVAKNETVKKAGLFTGHLGVKRAIQTRTLRKAHPDQHWVNCMNLYIFHWLIQLRALTDGIEFFGQEDKAKSPVGDSVAISSGVRANVRSAIVDVNEDNALAAMDHNFHSINLVLSVTLRCNIPNTIGGSFFIGDEVDGKGQLFYTLCDAVFDPSRIFDHTAQLIDCINKADLKPFLLVLQTDGGPDHCIKFATTKNAMVALFKKLDLDHLVVLRGAPNGSAYNKIEREMSPANSALANVSIKRGVMASWAENFMKSANSMSDICIVNENQEKKRANARKRIELLDLQLVVHTVKKYLKFLLTVKYLLTGGQDESIDSVSNVVLGWIGINVKYGIQLSDAIADIEMEDGQSRTRSSTITEASILSKQAAAEVIVSRDFHAAYDASVKEPMDGICECLSRLVISGKPVNVTPRVGPSIENDLHCILSKIDGDYNQSLRSTEDAKKMPVLAAWMSKHALIHPYSISIKKCSDSSCCKPCRSSTNVHDLVMQRQPTPILDTTNSQRMNHFLSRDNALRLFGDKPGAISDLTDLPSKKVDESKQSNKDKATRDKEVATKLKLHSWESKKVRSVVQCFNCNKPRCIFSVEMNALYFQAAKELKQTMESLSGYSCGDLIFDDNHPTSQVVAQRQQLTCESRVETAYYNVEGRSFKTMPVCIHCGETGGCQFLYQQTELEEHNKSDGKQCYPICIDCLDEGEKVIHYSKSKTNQQQKRKEDATNKTAAASKRTKNT